MNRGSFNLIKTVFNMAYPQEAREAYDALTPAEQSRALFDILEENITYTTGWCKPADADAFVLIYRSQTGKGDVAALRKELKIPAPKGWARALPFVNVMALVSQWPAEYARVADIAATIPHAALLGDPAVVDTFIAAGVRDVLGMGGLEDLDDPRAVGPSDPIMKLFIDAVKFQLMTVTSPAWFKDGKVLDKLPDGVSPTSALELAVLAEAESLKAKEEARRAAAAKRREEQLAAYKAKRTAFFAGPISKDAAVAAVAKAMATMEFAALRDATSEEVWLTDDLQKHAATYVVATPLPTAPAEPAEGATKEAKAAYVKALAAHRKAVATIEAANIDLGEATMLVQQYLLESIKAVKPDWLHELSSGNIAVRRGLGKTYVPVDRSLRRIRYAISKLIAEEGEPKVLDILKKFIADPAGMQLPLRGGDEA